MKAAGIAFPSRFPGAIDDISTTADFVMHSLRHTMWTSLVKATERAYERLQLSAAAMANKIKMTATRYSSRYSGNQAGR